MDKITIKNFNLLPVSFIDISPSSNSDLFTRAKLKVFYIGETADHRLFTKDFSEKLIKSIGYTPIVSHYDKESKDFIGHDAEQDIYGIVDPMVAPSFIEEDNVTWAICDVILYTKRPDKTGEIAQKIIGHAQSLELNPDTVKYKINRDFMGRFKNIEFTEGQFIGVSVLGKNQEPAFTGAEFFSTDTFKQYCEQRGKEMNLEIEKFIDLSWGEKGKLVCQALCAKYEDNYGYTVDQYDSYVIAYIWDEETKSANMYKIDYSIDAENKVVLGNSIKVMPTYTEYVAKKVEETSTNPIASSTEKAAESVTDAACGDGKKKKADAECGDPLKKKEEDQNDEEDLKKKKGNCVNDEHIAEENKEQPSVSSLAENERKELDEYRKKDKISLINSYSEVVPTAELTALTEKVNEYSKEELTNILNGLFVKYAKEKLATKVDTKPTQEVPTSFIISNDDIQNDDDADLSTHLRNLLKRK